MTQDKQTNPQSTAQEAPAETLAAEDTFVFDNAREQELLAEVANLKDQLLRALAETENVRRRLEQQAEDRGKYAVSSFARDMLSVADNLRRALDAVPAAEREQNGLLRTLTEGVEMTERELLRTFEKHGIKPIDAMGQRFDPNLHQAMMEVEDPSKPAGTVVLVAQTGYTISDRLLRAAMVGVSKGGPRPSSDESQRVDTTV